MKRNRRPITVYAVLSLGLLADQLGKSLAQVLWRGGGAVGLLWGRVQLACVETPGLLTGLFAPLPWSVRKLALIGTAMLLVLLLASHTIEAREQSRAGDVAAALICAGAIGNILDRFLSSGHVVEFISVGWGGWRSGVVNLADLYVLGGLLLLGASLAWRTWRRLARA